MKISQLSIDGVHLVTPTKLGDSRGAFARLYCEDTFQHHDLNTKWVQMNLSRSAKKGTVRGLHFQVPPFSEVKLVRAVKGEILDVVLDLRQGSVTFGQHCAVELDSDAMHTLYIPQGCAHGFQTLTDDVELHYMHSVPYTPESEGGVRFDDPALGIPWPLTVADASPRDLSLPYFSDIKPMSL